MSTDLDILKSCGLKVKSSEDFEKEFESSKPKREKADKPPVIEVKGGVKETAVSMGLIPLAYKDAEFDEQHIKDNIVEQVNNSRRKFKVRQFSTYIETLNGIITQLRTRNIPSRSYIIGAPNGFGKTSFVNSCIKILVNNDWQAAPYVSLYELAELRAETEKQLINGVKIGKIAKEEGDSYYYKDRSTCVKMPRTITGRFSWSEYMSAEVLFCFFSSLDSKAIESSTLKCILDIRSAKGLPTIAFISTSLDPYKADYNLREYIWDEILTTKKEVNCYDRVYHVSCYKVSNNIIGDTDLGIGN